MTHVREIVAETDSRRTGPAQSEAVQTGAAGAGVAELLRALQAGEARAPETLLPFIDDARVPSALLEAAATTSMPLLGNLAHVLGRAGLAGATGPLRARLSELAGDTRTFEDDSFFNARAGALSAVAGALLRLQPGAREPVDTLLRLLDHPNGFNRRTAAAALAEAVSGIQLPGDTADVVRNRLTSLIQTTDVGLFAAVAPAIFGEHADFVLGRCRALLDSATVSNREIAIALLSKLNGDEARDLLVLHAIKESDLHLACLVALRIGERIPLARRRELAQRALSQDSPSMRHDGLLLLSALDAETSQPLAKAALQDEPDPLLRSNLEAIVGS